jgi:hypothetical protein
MENRSPLTLIRSREIAVGLSWTFVALPSLWQFSIHVFENTLADFAYCFKWLQIFDFDCYKYYVETSILYDIYCFEFLNR